MLNKIFVWDIIAFSFIVVVLSWWSEFLIFPSQIDGSKKGKRSFLYILISVVVSILVSGGLAIIGRGNITIIRDIIRILGVIVGASGVILRYWSIYLLGNEFTRGIDSEKEQELVSKGPYKILRHPMYLGLLLLIIGVTIYIGNIFGILISLVIMFLSLKNRIRDEEHLMEETLGKKYLKWKENRYKLIPYLY